MNKTELIDKLIKKAGLKRAEVELLVNTLIETVMAEVSSGSPVKLVGFGTFDHSIRRARKRRNPKTGDTILVPALKAPRFRPSDEFKKKLNK